MAQTLEQFGKSVIVAELMTKDELKAWFTALPADRRPRDAETFAQRLREDGKLTAYQSQVLLQGKPQALTFGNYVLVSQLGSGASGHVFKARHKLSGRPAAIKVLAAEVARDAAAVKRFRREVEAAGRLDHPHIVRSIDAGEFNGQHYLVMDYVDGSDLASIVKQKGPLAVEEAIHCVMQAAEGFRYAHEQGVIHRDIKPGNLLLDKNGTVRILDLGLVRFEDSGDGLTATQQVMGTIDYMSPEQSADTKRADARCDIYSLGVTLWHLLTGRRMYDSKNLVERIMMHRSAPIPSLSAQRPDVSPQLEAVFQRMVAKKPDDRYQSMAEVVRALQAVLSGEEELAEVQPTESMEQSIMSLSKGDLAEFLRRRDEAAAPTAIGAVVAESVSVAGAFDFAVDTTPKSKQKAAKPAAAGRDGAEAKGLDRRLLIGGAVAAGIVVAVVVWLALR